MVQKSRQPIFNIPPVTLSLTALLLGIYLLGYVESDFLRETFIFAGFSPRFYEAMLAGEPVYRPVLILLSPITYSLLHGSWAHLLINSAFLIAFGSLQERIMGREKLILFVMLTSICSALGPALSYVIAGVDTYVIGASGVVSGLLGGFLRLRPGRKLPSLMAFIALNLVIALVGGYLGGEAAIIAWDAHIMGAVGGFLLIPLFVRRLPPAPPPAGPQ